YVCYPDIYFFAYDNKKTPDNKMTVYYYRFMTILFQLNEKHITTQHKGVLFSGFNKREDW
ncbi:hypothetical protein, partial [Enterobacter cloacae]|uniref:hypothetical protein n=1 Tax=Enterobacter cloacae TaxID=550 RepID=UPI001F2B31D5